MNTSEMTLQKLGGDYQLVIDSPKDLQHIRDLDEVHWMATSAPCYSFSCDPAFLTYLDVDRNDRIRSSEVKQAQKWLFEMLSDRSHLGEGLDALPLDWIDTSHDEGVALTNAAKRILTNIGLPDATEITLKQVRNRQRIVSSGTCNGDGIIPPASVDDAALTGFINDIIAAIGGVKDAGGNPGVGDEQLKAFLTNADAYLAWRDEAIIPDGCPESAIMGFGADTPEIYRVVSAVRSKVDEFFDRCWLISANLPPDRRAPGVEVNENSGREFCRESPLSHEFLRPPQADEILIIDERINPEFRAAMVELREVIFRQLGKNDDDMSITRNEWESILTKLSGYGDWLSRKPGGAIEEIGEQRLKEHLDGGLPDQLAGIIRDDAAVADELKLVKQVERLLLYHRWFTEFANNFVSFSQLFDPASPSLIQTGALIIDGRQFDLTMKVKDRATHKKIVEQSNICVMYLNIERRIGESTESMEVAAAVTSGSMTRLFVGKAGVFFTPDRLEWDATVVDFVANPVSLGEAIRKPFVQLGEFLKSQMERFGSTRYKAIEKQLATGIQTAEESLASEDANKTAPDKEGGNLQELMIGGSVAFAALGSAFAFITKTLQKVTVFDMFTVVGGIAAVIFIPVIVISIIKLRNRNLSVFLEACGWAINGQMRLSYHMGLLFTREPKPGGEVRFLRVDTIRRLLRKTCFRPPARIAWIIGFVVFGLLAVYVGWSFLNGCSFRSR